VIGHADLDLISWVETAEQGWAVVESFYGQDDQPAD